MRLTKNQKEEFIAKVMKDTPRDKLNGLRAEAVQSVIDDALSEAPDSIKQAWTDPEAKKWLKRTTVVLPGALGNIYEACPHGGTAWRHPSDAVRARLNKLEGQYAAELKRLNALEAGLRGVVASVTTRGALLTALPEFKKYLPPEVGNDRSVPAISNLVASFVEAGWPKS